LANSGSNEVGVTEKFSSKWVSVNVGKSSFTINSFGFVTCFHQQILNAALGRRERLRLEVW